VIESEGLQLGIFSPIDVSHQRAVESEIRLLNVELEQRVVERTSNLQEALNSLQSMQNELVRSEKLASLGSLVAGIAHELNTPIGNSMTVSTTIEEYATVMVDELQSPRPRRSLLEQSVVAIQKGASILTRNLHRAATLVSSFKQVAVDQSSDNRRQFNLKVVLEEVMLTLESMYKKSSTAELSLAPEIVMDSYPGALAQVLTNFVANALAHGFDGRTSGVMRLSTRLLENDQVEIVFADDGVGIAQEHIGRVFDPFFTTKLGQGGSGLGMHIVYNLVTGVLGGELALHSELGHGVAITVTLPLVAGRARVLSR
jgi:signal transduction histidine kinase